MLKEVVVERYKGSCRIKAWPSLAVLARIKRVLVPRYRKFQRLTNAKR